MVSECPAGWIKVEPDGAEFYFSMHLLVIDGPRSYLKPLAWEVRERPLILRWN